MINTLRNRLRGYATSAGSRWELVARDDVELTTEVLVRLALDEVRADRTTDERSDTFALQVLQARADEATSEVVIKLLDDPEADARELAARVMREFPRLDEAPTRWSSSFVKALSQAVHREDDSSALWYELSALGWQKLPEARPALLDFAGHGDSQIRRVVADDLKMTTVDQPIPEDINAALLRLAVDPEAEVRWSVFYDVSESPELFSATSWLPVCECAATEDPAVEVREQALGAVRGLSDGGAKSAP